MQEQPKSAFGLDQNVAAGLAYIPVCLCHFIVSIAILATDKTNKLTRFHAIQSLLISASMLAGYILMFIVVALVVVIAGVVNSPGFAFLAFIAYIAFFAWIIALFVGLVISMINGFQGKIFKLPLLGNLADKWS